MIYSDIHWSFDSYSLSSIEASENFNALKLLGKTSSCFCRIDRSELLELINEWLDFLKPNLKCSISFTSPDFFSWFYFFKKRKDEWYYWEEKL